MSLTFQLTPEQYLLERDTYIENNRSLMEQVRDNANERKTLLDENNYLKMQLKMSEFLNGLSLKQLRIFVEHNNLTAYMPKNNVAQIKSMLVQEFPHLIETKEAFIHKLSNPPRPEPEVERYDRPAIAGGAPKKRARI